MKFTFLNASDDMLINYVAYLAIAVIGLVILYHLIRSAVREGLISASRYERNRLTDANATVKDNTDANFTPKQREIQKLYDKGALTFDEYKRQWDEAQK